MGSQAARAAAARARAAAASARRRMRPPPVRGASGDGGAHLDRQRHRAAVTVIARGCELAPVGAGVEAVELVGGPLDDDVGGGGCPGDPAGLGVVGWSAWGADPERERVAGEVDDVAGVVQPREPLGWVLVADRVLDAGGGSGHGSLHKRAMRSRNVRAADSRHVPATAMSGAETTPVTAALGMSTGRLIAAGVAAPAPVPVAVGAGRPVVANRVDGPAPADTAAASTVTAAAIGPGATVALPPAMTVGAGSAVGAVMAPGPAVAPAASVTAGAVTAAAMASAATVLPAATVGAGMAAAVATVSGDAVPPAAVSGPGSVTVAAADSSATVLPAAGVGVGMPAAAGIVAGDGVAPAARAACGSVAATAIAVGSAVPSVPVLLSKGPSVVVIDPVPVNAVRSRSFPDESSVAVSADAMSQIAHAPALTAVGDWNSASISAGVR